MTYIVTTKDLNSQQPLSANGKYLYKQYDAINSFISSNNREFYSISIAKPILNDSKVEWFSDKTGNWENINSLSDDLQNDIMNQYWNFRKHIHSILKRLQSSDNKKQIEEWNEIISILFKDGCHDLYYNGNDICIIWGWEISSRTFMPPANFKLENDEEPISPQNDPKEINDEANTTGQPETRSPRYERTIDEYQESESLTNNQRLNDNSHSPDENNEHVKKTFPWYYYLAIVFFILISALIWYMIISAGKDTNPRANNEIISVINPGKPVKIPKEDVIRDTVNRRFIVQNIINMAILNDTSDALGISNIIIDELESDSIKLLAYDTTIMRFQFRIDEPSRKTFKSKVKAIFPEKDIIVWDEYLFSNTYSSNDPFFSDNSKSWYFDAIGVQKAWDVTTGDSSVVVAVLDNGFDINHIELKNRIAVTYNAVDGSTDVSPDNSSQGSSDHGTHVASTVAGNINNNSGTSGIAPKVRIMAIKVSDSNGMMSSSYIINGLLYAAKNGADVINMSIGMYFDSTLKYLPPSLQEEMVKNSFKDEEALWRELFGYIEKRKVTCVMAAGNQKVVIGLDPMNRSGSTIIVSATDQNGTAADFSNFGSRSTISAPGKGIYNAIPGDNYAFLDGTSMACPIVSGAVALVKSIKPELPNNSIISLLKSTAIGKDSSVGPLIQVDRFLTGAKNLSN